MPEVVLAQYAPSIVASDGAFDTTPELYGRGTPVSFVSTGIAGLDYVLCGGLPQGRLYLIQGEPGTGKTTLAMQFLLAGRDLGETVMYITLSETEEELRAVAHAHRWDLSGLIIRDLSVLEEQLGAAAENTLFHPSEIELTDTMQVLLASIEALKPQRLVFDSVSELRLMSEGSFRFRRHLLFLKRILGTSRCTVLFTDDLSVRPDQNVQSLMHGVIHLERTVPAFGTERRKLQIMKLRGVNYRSGKHDLVLKEPGMIVFPRMVSAEYAREYQMSRLSTGVENLDALLGGGLERATSSLFMGPSGTGKSTLALQVALAAIARGEPVTFYAFEEGIELIKSRMKMLMARALTAADSSLFHLQKVDPAELSPGEFAHLVQEQVVQRKTRVVVLDSLNGYIHAMGHDEHILLQLHELLAYLAQFGVATILVLAQKGLTGAVDAPADLTYLADTVVITRYFEAAGAVRKAVSVIKKRTGPHEETIRELRIDGNGIQVGPALAQFQGILNGSPTFLGHNRQLMPGDGSV